GRGRGGQEAQAWEALSDDGQERVMGRTKPDSVELEDKPSDSHVASTDQDRFGKVFRRNMPYGTVTDHGTMFVGFCAQRQPLADMLKSMAGLDDGTRGPLTRHTHPPTGALHLRPPHGARRRLRGAPAPPAGPASPRTADRASSPRRTW